MVRCINRLEEHDEGTITVDAIELGEDTSGIRAARQEVGMVFQQFSLFSHLTVLENLTICPIRVRKLNKVAARLNLKAPLSASDWMRVPCGFVNLSSG